MATPADPAAFSRHPGFWCDDGNVVLIAAAENIGFRVHKSILARHSEIFSDMFSVPQPPTVADEDLIDGCSVVRMADETAEELAVIFEIIYNGGAKYYGAGTQVSFRTVIIGLTIGSKFQFKDIRNEAVRRLSICFPESLTDFHNEVSGGITHDRVKKNGDFICPIAPFAPCEDAIAVLHVARRLELPDLLPATLYLCAQLSSKELFDALRPSQDNFRRLCIDDVELCIRAQDLAQQKMLVFFNELSNGRPPFSCTGYHAEPSSCKRARLRILTSLMPLYRGDSWKAALLPLQSRINLNWYIAGTDARDDDDKLCQNCVNHLVVSMDVEPRRKLWNDLKAMFVYEVGP